MDTTAIGKSVRKSISHGKKLRNFAQSGSFLVSSRLFEMPQSGIMTASVIRKDAADKAMGITRFNKAVIIP